MARAVKPSLTTDLRFGFLLSNIKSRVALAVVIASGATITKAVAAAFVYLVTTWKDLKELNSYVKISYLTKVADQKDVRNLFETAIDLVVVKGFLEKMAAEFDHHLELIPKKKEQEDVIRKKKHGELKLVFHKKSVYQNEK